MNWRDRIELTPRPTLKGSGVSVEAVMATLGAGETIESLLSHTPELTRDDVTACLAYAAEAVARKSFIESFERGLEDVAAGRLVDDDEVWAEIDRERGSKD